jgi:hypothetical protein
VNLRLSRSGQESAETTSNETIPEHQQQQQESDSVSLELCEILANLPEMTSMMSGDCSQYQKIAFPTPSPIPEEVDDDKSEEEEEFAMSSPKEKVQGG